MILLVFYLKLVMSLGHRHVIVKRALIGSKGGWKLSTLFLSCKVFHDWSIIKNWCGLEKRTLHFGIFFNEIFLSCRVPTFRGQKVVKHGGHHGISYLFIC